MGEQVPLFLAGGGPGRGSRFHVADGAPGAVNAGMHYPDAWGGRWPVLGRATFVVVRDGSWGREHTHCTLAPLLC